MKTYSKTNKKLNCTSCSKMTWGSIIFSKFICYDCYKLLIDNLYDNLKFTKD